MNKKPIIYLAGPIGGIDYEEATNWRQVATKDLQDYFEIRDPMRHKKDKYDSLDNSYSYFGSNIIVQRDLMDIRQSDGMKVNFEYGSIGTMLELGVALERGLPVFMWVDLDTFDPDHPFMERLVTYYSDFLDDVTDTVKEFYLPEGY